MKSNPPLLRILCRVALALGGLGLAPFSLSGQVLGHIRWEKGQTAQTQKLKTSDSLAFRRSLKERLERLRQKGYLLATCDSLYRSSRGSLQARCRRGPLFHYGKIRSRHLPDKFVGAFQELRGKPLKAQALRRKQARLLAYAEENGRPFARLEVDTLAFDNATVALALRYRAGPKVRFDTLRVLGSADLNKNFLADWLRIADGEPFNQARMRAADHLLRQLPYIRLQDSVRADFLFDEAVVQINAAKREVNQFDGVVGFLPNQAEDGQLMLSGQVHLDLYNLFRGEHFFLEWQRTKARSQVLNTEISLPALLGTPVGGGLRFDLLKEDTLFLNRDLQVFAETPDQWGGIWQASAGFDRSFTLSSELPSEEADRLQELRYDYFGLGYRLARLDDPLLPRQGWAGRIRLEGGNKRATDSAGQSQQGAQYRFRARGSYYWQLGPGLVWYQRLMGAWLQSRQLFRNDLFRLGGLQSLRGFNQNFFFASAYGLYRSELRLFWGESSYLSGFLDPGYLWNRTADKSLSARWVVGFGLGLSFRVRSGLFTLQYSLGQSAEQAASLATSKVHFGLITRF